MCLTTSFSRKVAFWTQLKREILLPREEWDRRLQRPTAYTFVALKKEEDTIISSLIVRGPLPTSDLTSPIWMQLGHAGCSEYWEINAVFTTENNRRKGVMSAMIDEAVRVVKKFVSEQQEDQKRKTFVRVLVLVGNEEATGLYEKAGFTEKWENSGEWELVRWIGFDDASSPGAAGQLSDGLSPV